MDEQNEHNEAGESTEGEFPAGWELLFDDAAAEADEGESVLEPSASAPPPPPPPPESPQPELEEGATEQLVAANAEVVPESKRTLRSRLHLPRLHLGRRWAWVFASLGLLLVIATGGAAYATYRYSQEYSGKILPGSTIAGVDVGGMTEDEARAAVREAMRPQLNRPLNVIWEDKTWTVTPKRLGARGNVSAVVHEALEASSDASFFQKMRMRLFNQELSFERPVAITYPAKGARGYIEGLASSFDREPRDASIDYSTGWVDIVEAQEGRKIVTDESFHSLRTALQNGDAEAELAVRTTQPKITSDKFKKVLLVRIGENKLYLYENGKITHTWPVATGQPSYPTPTGVFEIVEKRYMPTWVNPAPDTWGASMPPSIPPGPGNPLGLRALNWSAPAIRFHGTEATYSLGYNASHGCVRMANEDVIELYDLVDVGTPIVSTVVAPLRPLYSTSTVIVDPQPVPPSDDSTADEEDQTQDAKGKGN